MNVLKFIREVSAGCGKGSLTTSATGAGEAWGAGLVGVELSLVFAALNLFGGTPKRTRGTRALQVDAAVARKAPR